MTSRPLTATAVYDVYISPTFRPHISEWLIDLPNLKLISSVDSLPLLFLYHYQKLTENPECVIIVADTAGRGPRT